MADRDDVVVALRSLGDQVQALCQNAGIRIAAVVLFSQDGPMEYRSPHPREEIIKHLRKAADELEKDY